MDGAVRFGFVVAAGYLGRLQDLGPYLGYNMIFVTGVV
jgi:hypothetical protein